jgi:hypothetical protein
VSFEAILIGWGATSLLAGGGLVVWFVVELKLLSTWLAARRWRRHRYELPRARVADKARRYRTS